MCGMCGLWGGFGHWSDAHRLPTDTVSGRPLAALRLSQAAAISSFTEAAGVSVRDWMQSSWIVESRSGASEIVDTLPDIWLSVERLSNGELDPLSPEFIRLVEARNARRKSGH